MGANVVVTWITLMLLATPFGVGASEPADIHAEHGHAAAHAGHGADAFVAPAQRHATDAPLRAGMASIRERIAQTGPDAAPSAVLALADGIDADVQRLFAECKLAPEADAALHGTLALLLQGAAGLRADRSDATAWASLHEALERYRLSFDDPDFDAAPGQ